MFSSHVNTHACFKEKETLSTDLKKQTEHLQNSLDLCQLLSLQKLAAIEGFEPTVNSHSYFFCKKFKIILRHPDLPADTFRVVTLRLTLHKQDTPLLDERHGLQNCTRRMLQNILPEGHSCTSFQELLFEIFDEEDPFTLLQFRLTRSKFSELRNEQRLLVDFNGFPDVVIELLQRCNVSCEESLKYSQDSSTLSNDSQEKSMKVSFQETSSSLHRTSSHYSLIPLLLCEISATSSGSDCSTSDFFGKYRQPSRIVFTLVETNNFRELTHLFLPFSVASPTATLCHLAERFSHVKRYTICLETNFRKLKDLYSQCLQEIQSKNQCIEDVKNQLQTIRCQLTECHQEEILRIKQETGTTLLVTEKTLKEEYKKKEIDFLNQIEILKKEQKVLQDFCANLKDNLSNISLDKEECENINKSLKETVQSLTQKLAIETTTSLTLKENNANLTNECQSFSSRLKEEEENVRQLTEQLQRLDEYKVKLTNLTQRELELCTALQTSSLEIEKGNKLIETLQQALRKERNRSKNRGACCHRSYITQLYEKENIDTLSQHGHLLLQREASLLKQVENLQHQLHKARQTEEHQKIKIETLQSQFKETSVQALLNTSLQLQTNSPAVSLSTNDLVNYPKKISTHHNYATRFYSNSRLPNASSNFPTPSIDEDENPSDTLPYPAPKPTEFSSCQSASSDSKLSKLPFVSHKTSSEPTLLAHVSSLHQTPSVSIQKSNGAPFHKVPDASLLKTTGVFLDKTTKTSLRKSSVASLRKPTGKLLHKTAGASFQKTLSTSLDEVPSTLPNKVTGRSPKKFLGESPRKNLSGSPRNISTRPLKNAFEGPPKTFLEGLPKSNLRESPQYRLSESSREPLGGSFHHTLSGSPQNTTHALLNNDVIPPNTHRSTDTTPSFSTSTFFNDACTNEEKKNESCGVLNAENVLGVSVSTYESSIPPHFG